jgi:pantetheine-phosphate adenylyltransferase
MIGVYAGTFDPPTKGHEFVIRAAAKFAKRLIVAVGVNPDKHPVFSSKERVAMLKAMTADLPNVEVQEVTLELLVDFVKRIGANHIIRGIRTVDDFKFEQAIWVFNYRRVPDIMTLWFPAPPELSYVSSSFVRGFVGTQGWEETVREFLPDTVYERFVAKYRQILLQRSQEQKRDIPQIVAEVLPEILERVVPEVIRRHLPQLPFFGGGKKSR